MQTTDVVEIPVIFRSRELFLKARIVRSGYVHQIIVDVNNVPVTIELDEEGNYRAIGDAEKMEAAKVDVDLIKEIIAVLQSL